MPDLLQLALDAHGGIDRWREIKAIDLTLRLSGRLWDIKGSPEGLPGVRMRIDAHRPAVVTNPFKGGVGRFDTERVWIENEAGRMIESRANPRANFDGVLSTKWDRLGELYFSSYTLWNYLTTPFLLADPRIETEELGPHQENGETWRRLQARFPQAIPTHCASQVFYFAEDGLLRRLDYETEILGDVAAHYCFDHGDFSGIKIPTLRRVVSRREAGPVISRPTAVLMRIFDVVVIPQSREVARVIEEPATAAT